MCVMCVMCVILCDVWHGACGVLICDVRGMCDTGVACVVYAVLCCVSFLFVSCLCVVCMSCVFEWCLCDVDGMCCLCVVLLVS